MNDNPSQALAEQLQSSTKNVDVFLALQALSCAAPAVAFEAITTFMRSAPANQLPLARNALLELADRAPALLVSATLDEDAKVADAARQALLIRPSNEALPLYLRMAKSKSVDEACSGCMYLGRISSPQARAPLFKALGHRSAAVREYAATSIHSHADEHWIADLLEAIRTLRREETDKKKDFGEVINTLCSAVVQKSTHACLDLLMEGLHDADARVRGTCISALGRLGDTAAVVPLIETLEHPRRGMPRELRTALVKVLGELGDTRAIAPLLRAGVTVAAPALGPLKAQEAVPELMAALEQARTPRDADELAEVLAQLQGPGESQWPRAGLRTASLQVRRAAALQLARTAPQEAAQHLRAMLPQLCGGDAVGVAEALALMGSAEGFEGFAKALADDPHHWNASAVAYACQNLRGPQVQALLLGLIPGIRNEYVHHVCKALAAQGAEVLPALIAAAQAAGDSLRYRYVMALAEFRDPQGAGLLAPLMVRRNPLRDAAMLSLSATPSAEASAALAAALRQAESPADARLITETLAKAATREAIPDLIRALQADLATEEILEALGRLGSLGDRAVVPALIDQLSSPNARRRQAAAMALGQIADPAAGAPLVRLLLKEFHLEVAQAAMQAWLAMGAQDGGALDGLGAPGTRAFLLASARQLRRER
ncbi:MULTISPECIES: HEAT repeat domain-containing protein [Delftia]|uniref:HEAT repeat domain-containing protein n=1 Tax=Delftia TaxID=80865 RepID=UPI0002EBD61D|nr:MULTISPECIES: HEAT repeat domain-containing protein [Delftia]MPT51820.1 HEAT repeat domain-containing protein [Delftia sp.]SFB54827.1 HEAT repeat [Delftia tsuruhatensis]